MQIVKLFVETFKRLAIATGDSCVTAAKLWENIYALMTDAVKKNLHIEGEVAKQLESQHVPIHILCKLHTCEKLDGACTDSLVRVEADLKDPRIVDKMSTPTQIFY